MTIGNLTQLVERLNVSKTRISQIKQKGILNGIMEKQRSGAFLLDIETAVKIIKENAEPYGRGHTIKIIPTALSPSEITPKEQTFSYFRNQKEKGHRGLVGKLILSFRSHLRSLRLCLKILASLVRRNTLLWCNFPLIRDEPKRIMQPCSQSWI